MSNTDNTRYAVRVTNKATGWSMDMGDYDTREQAERLASARNESDTKGLTYSPVVLGSLLDD